jgi:spermidine synthase
MIWIVGLIFFHSGAAALVFETLWFRQAGLAFGNSVWASSIVLASFMAGLALGNALAARYAHRVRRPVRAFALLELVVATSGMALVWVLPGLGAALTPVLRPFFDAPWTLNALRGVATFLVLLLPATAMGATLPLLVKALRAHDPSFGSILGNLYGWNTLGAVAGALAGEIVLIELLGVRGSATVAASLNGVAVLGSFAVSRRIASKEALHTPDRDPSSPPRLGFDAVRFLSAAALAGGVLLGLEVVWFRFLLLFVHGGSLAFSIMLAVVLAGISLGSVGAAAVLRRREGAQLQASSVAFVAGACIALLYRAYELAHARYSSSYIFDVQDILWLSAVLMLPGCLLSGALFTLTGTALWEKVRPDTRAVGLLTMANTLGAALGALVAGFVCLPLLGMERSFFAAALSYGVVGLLLVRGRRRTRTLRDSVPTSVALAVFVAALLFFPFGRMQEHYMRIPVQRYDPDNTMQVNQIREGRAETIAYLRRDFAGETLFHTMLTNGFSMSGTRPGSRRYMKLYAYFPVALHPSPRRALLISYGVGSTAKSLTDTAQLESIDVVDISKEILEMSDIVFSDPGQHPLHDSRVRVHVEDGRYFLQTHAERYDIITGEPPPPKVAGVVNLYTREYFQLVHDRLAEGGIHTYWLPVHGLTSEDTRAIIRAYCDVFGDCSLWSGWNLEWMLVGTRAARPTSQESFVRQWQDPRVAPELAALGLETPEQLGALFMADAAVLRRMVVDTEPLTDEFPKRLSHRIMASDEAQRFYSEWMNTDLTRARFEDSEFVRRHWPAELRQRTLPYFAFQRIVNEVAVQPGPRGTPARFFADLHAILSATPLRTLALWHLGLNVDQLPIIDRRIAAGDSPQAYSRQLAWRRIAARDFTAAAAHLEVAALQDPANRFLDLCRLFTLCMAGQADSARAVAQTGLEARAPDGGDRGFWHWAQAVFDVQPPAALTP